MSSPNNGHVTVSAENGVLEIQMPAETIATASGVIASDKNLRTRLPHFGAELADGFTTEPQRPREPQQIRIVRIILVKTEIVGETIIELHEPVQVFA